MVIAVKYCGGCNSTYDRGATIERLRREFPDITIVNAESQDGVSPDLVLVVCGCSSVCAAHVHLDGKRGKIVTACEGDFAKVRDRLNELTSGGTAR